MEVFITPFTLNEAQRRYPALAQKEAEGWWTGSIEGVAYTIWRSPAQPTAEEVAHGIAQRLTNYGYSTTAEDLLK